MKRQAAESQIQEDSNTLQPLYFLVRTHVSYADFVVHCACYKDQVHAAFKKELAFMEKLPLMLTRARDNIANLKQILHRYKTDGEHLQPGDPFGMYEEYRRHIKKIESDINENIATRKMWTNKWMKHRANAYRKLDKLFENQ